MLFLVSLPFKNMTVKSPIFSPNGKYVLWLQRKAGGPHASAMQLVRADTPLNENVSLKNVFVLLLLYSLLIFNLNLLIL